MKVRWTALFGVLVLACLMPVSGSAQSGGQKPPQTSAKPTGGLVRNWPNPFNPETFIEFTVTGCTDGVTRVPVTLIIRNTLAQPVAYPVLQGSGKQINKLLLECGAYTAYFNGKYTGTTKEVSSGVYTAVLEVGGHRTTLKMLVVK